MPPSDRFVAETTFHVRYAETDAMGIVHHSNYIVYFEEGRSTYTRQRGHPYARLEASGYYLTVAEVGVRYLQAARYDQRITVRTWIAALKSRSLVFNYEIVDAETDKLFVTGFSKHICITHEGHVARIPEPWREWLNP